jgi:predicted flap endonuclease-1-like 5' DNA nuclease
MTVQSNDAKGGLRWWDWLLMVVGVPTAALLIWLWLRHRAERKTTRSVRMEITLPYPATEAPVTTAEPAPDDLKRIEGIGPKTASVFQTAGITTFAGLAATDVEQLRAILREAGIRTNPSTWPEQAHLAAAGRWDALQALQAELKGGRRA